MNINAGWPFFACFLSCLSSLTNGETILSALEGTDVEIRCFSSFPPPWSWFGPKDGQHKTLAISGAKSHPKLHEPRYHFLRLGNEYVIKIINSKTADAGKFVCDGDTYQVTLLNVMR